MPYAICTCISFQCLGSNQQLPRYTGGDARRLLTQPVRRDALKVKQTKHRDGVQPFQTKLLCVKSHVEPNLFVLVLVAAPGG